MFTDEQTQSLQTLAVLADTMFEGVQVLDPSGTYLYLNAAAAAHGRSSPAELIGRRITDCYPGIEQTEMYTLVRSTLRERAPHQMVNQFTYPDGQVAWFDLRMTPVPQGVLILSIDITAQKKTEEELLLSREELQITLESMPDALITTDTQQRVTRMNPAAEQLTGWSATEALGRSLDELVGFLNQRTGEQVQHAVEEVIRDGVKRGLANDTYLVQRDGSRLPIASSGAPLSDAAGQIRGAVLVLKNMKDEYELRAMLNQAQKMEAIGRLAAGIAHDFNNMLTAIRGSAEFALQEAPADSEQSNDIKEILRAADQAAQLTRQLMVLSRDEKFQPVTLDLNDFLRDIATMIRRSVGKTITVETEYAAVPPIVFDVSHLRQIVLNLVVNARDAMNRRGTLALRTRDCDNYAALEVSDTGAGMDEDTRQRIFDPFFTTKPSDLGTGLGLATVYSMMDQAGGRIAVESEPGRGTTFRLLFPTTPTR